MTIRVLAVVVERLLQLTGSKEVQISDALIIDQPDLTAWRNESHHICMTTAR